MGKVVNIRRDEYDVRIDRASEWGNPFSHKEGTRAACVLHGATVEEVIEAYREWLWNEIRRGRWTLSELAALSDKRLACWCAPGPCHGDVLLRAAQWAENKLHEPKVIDSFSGEFRFLSNFAPCVIGFGDLIYPTTEHAFQAAKTMDKSIRVEIRDAETPGKAKRMGRHVVLREDWEDVKLSVMSTLLRAKFSKEPFRSKLLATGNAKLVEGNTWGDRFWGVCGDRGENNLGKMLMRVREELQR